MSVADKTHDAAEKGDVDRNTSGSASGSYTRDGGDGTNAIGLLQGEPLRRQLKSRHIQMISLGGVIGTGLFLGTAKSLAAGGPLGLLLGYGVMGTITYSVMIALGEMVAHLPIAGGHISLAHRFVDPAFSFMMGWNYWYNWTIVLPAELNAAAVLISYWNDTINSAAWIAICIVVAAAINFGGTKAYGEMEFWFAIIKVLTILGLILLGIILTSGGGPDHKVIGFKYWGTPGPFVQYLGIQGAKGRFLGFWAVLIQAAFSYIGTEIVAIAAGEAKNPKKNLPKAIKRVYIRIVLFYILGTFIIGMLVASSDPRLAISTGTAVSSPFVIAINNSAIKGLPSVVNAALLTSAWSAASSDIYTSSRALYGLAANGNAPRFLTKVNSWGLPIYCVLIAIAFSLLSFMSAGTSKAGEVFGWFANMTSVCGLITWGGICYTYLRFHQGMKLQGIDRHSLVYRAPFQPYLTYYGLIFCCIILFFNGWSVFINIDGNFDHATFWTSYIPIILLPFTYFGYKWTHKITTPSIADADFYSGSRVEEEEEDVPPHGFIQKAWAAIM